MKTKDWSIRLCCALAGIIIGMVIMYFIFVFGIERILNASEGIIQNVQINLNETKIVNGVMDWSSQYYSEKFSNFTTTNYSNCNGLIDKGCLNW